jgi:hypothetical protein
MRSFYLTTIAFCLVVARSAFSEVEADCSLEGHPICSAPCSGVCRAFYNPGPPETCRRECRNFLVPNGMTLKLEGITEDQKNRIEAIINAK